MEIKKATKTIRGIPIDWELQQHHAKWKRDQNRKSEHIPRTPSCENLNTLRNIFLFLTVIYYLFCLVFIIFLVCDRFLFISVSYDVVVCLYLGGLILFFCNWYMIMYKTYHVTTDAHRHMSYLYKALLSFVLILIFNTTSIILVVNFLEIIEITNNIEILFIVSEEIIMFISIFCVLRSIEELKNNMTANESWGQNMGSYYNPIFESRSFKEYWNVPSRGMMTQTVISKNLDVMESPYPWAYKQTKSAASVFDYC